MNKVALSVVFALVAVAAIAKKIIELKKVNPKLKIMLSIGGDVLGLRRGRP